MDLLLHIGSVLKYKKVGILLVDKHKSSIEISYYQLIKRKKSVDTCFVQEQLGSFKDLPSFAEKTPTILCIQGNGLVQRIVEANQNDIKQSIPNIDPEEYLVRYTELSDTEKLFRKEQIDSILNDPELVHIPFYNVSPGFSGLQRFIQLFDDLVTEFTSGGNTLLIKDGKIVDVAKSRDTTSQTYQIAGKERTSNEIIALCAGLNFYIGTPEEETFIPGVKQRVKEYTAQRLSEHILRYAGAGLFILLLINFLCFDNFNKKLNKLNLESQEEIKLQEEIKELQEDLMQKKQFASQNYVPDNYSFAFYADRLASFSSEGVRFTELLVCPVAGKIKEDNIIEFRGNTMQVKGISPNPSAFSSFMEKINNAAWVTKVNKQIYHYNNDNNNAEFQLEIILNDATE